MDYYPSHPTYTLTPQVSFFQVRLLKFFITFLISLMPSASSAHIIVRVLLPVACPDVRVAWLQVLRLINQSLFESWQ
jgi:hypothetical protein